jgi:hypothetical protein
MARTLSFRCRIAGEASALDLCTEEPSRFLGPIKSTGVRNDRRGGLFSSVPRAGWSNAVMELPRNIPLPVPEPCISYIAAPGGSSKYPAGLLALWAGHSQQSSAGALSQSLDRCGESVVSGERPPGVRSQPANQRWQGYIKTDISPVCFRFGFSRSFVINKISALFLALFFPQLRFFNNFSASFFGSFGFVFCADPLFSVTSPVRF